MPQLFKVGGYTVYFWMNESRPTEPLHVHVSKGRPTQNATKIWITSCGKALLCNNDSRIESHTLHNIMLMIEARSDEIRREWMSHFGTIRYYC